MKNVIDLHSPEGIDCTIQEYLSKYEDDEHIKYIQYIDTMAKIRGIVLSLSSSFGNVEKIKSTLTEIINSPNWVNKGIEKIVIPPYKKVDKYPDSEVIQIGKSDPKISKLLGKVRSYQLTHVCDLTDIPLMGILRYSTSQYSAYIINVGNTSLSMEERLPETPAKSDIEWDQTFLIITLSNDQKLNDSLEVCIAHRDEHGFNLEEVYDVPLRFSNIR